MPALTVCRRTVSGTVSLPSRGTFHLSLTVLVRYRSSGSIQAYQVVLTDSHGIPRAPCYSGTPARAADWRCGYGTHTLSGRPFKAVRLHHCTTPPTAGRQSKQDPTTPCAQPLPGITHARFGPIRVRSPLLTESLLFSLPAGTEMFHFPAFPPHRLCVQRQVTTPPRKAHGGVSPFGHPGITVRLSTPPGLSQIPTSFIGSRCQGIHRAPLET